MKDQLIERAYEIAKERYNAVGVDANLTVVHCPFIHRIDWNAVEHQNTGDHYAIHQQVVAFANRYISVNQILAVSGKNRRRHQEDRRNIASVAT